MWQKYGNEREVMTSVDLHAAILFTLLSTIYIISVLSHIVLTDEWVIR